MKKLDLMFVVLSIILVLYRASAEDSEPAKCKGVSGLSVMTDYTPSSKPYVKKTFTDLYTEYSSNYYFTHLAVASSYFKNENVIVIVELLNNKNKSLEKYVLDKWVLDKEIKGMKITKFSLLKFLESKLISPFDEYINLNKEEKRKIDIAKVPFNSKISIGYKNKSPFCSFDFKYATAFHDH